MSRWLVPALCVCVAACASLDNPLVPGPDGGGGIGGSGGSGGGSAGGSAGGLGGGVGGGSAGGAGGGAAGGSSGGAGGGVAGGTGGSGGGSACTPDWTCSPWTADGGTAARTCFDVNGCSTTAGKPAEGPLPLPALDLPFYRCAVQPIFDKGCSMMGCHGTDTGRPFRIYSRGRFRNDEMVSQVPTCPAGPQTLNLQQNGSGTVMCLGWSRLTANEWRKNFESSRLQAMALARPADSELLVQPTEGTALVHASVKLFTAGDAEYATVLAWLSGSTMPSTCDAGSN